MSVFVSDAIATVKPLFCYDRRELKPHYSKCSSRSFIMSLVEMNLQEEHLILLRNIANGPSRPTLDDE